MKEMCEKYIIYLIAILIVILIYRMYTCENRVQIISDSMWVVISQNIEIIDKLNQPLILDNK